MKKYLLMDNAIVLWFTGLSGSGKTTITQRLKKIIDEKGNTTLLLDGDDIRNNNNNRLSFSPDDIKRNNLDIIQLVLSNIERYDFILVSVITPFEASRKIAKDKIGKSFIEVYVKASLDTVIKRDVKGLYKKALSNEINNFIGISKNVPFEIPENSDIILDTEKYSIQDNVDQLINGIIKL